MVYAEELELPIHLLVSPDNIGVGSVRLDPAKLDFTKKNRLEIFEKSGAISRHFEVLSKSPTVGGLTHLLNYLPAIASVY